MYYQEKLEEINQKINEIKKGERIVVWPCGGHTKAMFGHTDLPCYLEWLEFVDGSKTGEQYMGRTIKHPKEVNWTEVKYAVISSLKYQKSIIRELREVWGFGGEIVSFYQDDVREFYGLYDGVHGISWGEEIGTWQEAEAYTGSVYRDESIMPFDIKRTKQLMKQPGVPDYFIISQIMSAYITYKKIVLIDYGGALGNEYFRNRDLLDKLHINYIWCVIDLDHNVEYGRQNFETEKLHFFRDIDEIKSKYGENDYIVYLRSSLQYMSDPYEVLKSFQTIHPKEIIIQDTPMAKQEHIVIQRVRDYGHGGVFPCRIFDENKVIKTMKEEGYRLYGSEKQIDMCFSNFLASYTRMIFKQGES